MNQAVRRVAVSCLIMAIASCGSNKKSEPQPSSGDAGPPVQTALVPGSDLWRFAPDDTAIGLVLEDGALETALATWSELVRIAEPERQAKEYMDDIAAWLESARLPRPEVDALARAGWDPSKGIAVFFDERANPLVIVLPVSDPAAFAAYSGAEAVDLGGRTVYRKMVGDGICVAEAGRLFCGDSLAAVDDAASAKGPGRLAQRVRSLAPELRGQLELVFDLARIPVLKGVRERFQSIVVDAGLVVVSARLRAGSASLRMWIEGTAGHPWGTALQAPTKLPHLDRWESGSFSSIRARLNMKQLLAAVRPSGQAPADAFDIRGDVVENLTGDIAIFARGRGSFSGVVALGLTDEARVREVLPELCTRVFRPFARVVAGPERCVVHLELPTGMIKHPLSSALATQLEGVSVVVEVRDKTLLVTLGDADNAQLAGQASSVLKRRAWQFRAQAQPLDPLATASPALAAAIERWISTLDDRSQAIVSATRWLAAHVAHLAFGIQLGDEGLHVVATLTAFAADPAPAYEAYRAAVRARRTGDLAGYESALRELRAAYPGTHASRHASAVLGEAASFGPATTVFLMAGLPALTRYLAP